MTPEGYPDDQELEAIEKWDVVNDVEGLLAYLRPRWKYGKWDCMMGRNDTILLEITTGGWSGNEDTIGALQRNFAFWSQYWHTHKRGGYYYFEIPLQPAPTQPSKES